MGIFVYCSLWLFSLLNGETVLFSVFSEGVFYHILCFLESQFLFFLLLLGTSFVHITVFLATINVFWQGFSALLGKMTLLRELGTDQFLPSAILLVMFNALPFLGSVWEMEYLSQLVRYSRLKFHYLEVDLASQR